MIRYNVFWYSDTVGEEMEQLVQILSGFFPDALFYVTTFIVFAVGIIKCSVPVMRNTRALKHAVRRLKEGAKAKLSRPVWSDPFFLGKKLQPVWKGFLHSADLAISSGTGTDVADYVHEDSVITEPGKASVADVIPGICTSLGILGTFVGLSMGLNGIDFMDINSHIQLTTGIALAFNTSIVGLLGSLFFNVYNKHAIGRARIAIFRFTNAFYAHALPQPADVNTQLTAYGHGQINALSAFARDVGVNVAAEVHQAMKTTFDPLQNMMNEFINAATRAQLDGLDFIVARFVDRLNSALDGQLQRLRESLTLTVDVQKKSQMDLVNMMRVMEGLAQNVTNIQGVSESVITKFAEYLQKMEKSTHEVYTTQQETATLLDEISQASLRQARYLSALQDYQTKLQSSFQEYSVWTERFVNSLDGRTASQTEALDHVSVEIRDSAEMLRGSYRGFVESIEVGLANALVLFDKNMQGLTKQIYSLLFDVQQTMLSLDLSMSRQLERTVGDPIPFQNRKDSPGEREVS